MINNALMALCAGCTLAWPAFAQSSVTVFGIVDLRVSRISNSGGDSMTALNHSGIGPSRWGVRGTEDLGDGLYAGFHLESQIRPDTGTPNPNKFWNRRSTVSLGSRGWGELRLGRDVTPSYRIITQFDPFTANGLGADINLIPSGPNANNGPAALRINTYNQADNAIVYIKGADEDEGGDRGGFYGNAMVAMGEGGSSDKYQGVHLGWKRGALNIAGHVARSDPAAGAVASPAAGTVTRYKTAGVGLSYAVASGTTLMAQYNQERSSRAKTVNYDEDWWLIGLVQRFGPGDVRLSYARRNSMGTRTESANDASMWALGYVYRLSKRTALYAMYASLDNSGTGTYLLPNGPTTIAPGGTSRGIDFGMHHKF